ncbi:unnamed protein product [Polarella glacialis]|uniref:Uncharacterized protein n=1 Tax=Polarella glacialis TaxID=89957 RepID=A0A813GM58_POLGL|nr:unnamed protein product [Polarella glacialis]
MVGWQIRSVRRKLLAARMVPVVAMWALSQLHQVPSQQVQPMWHQEVVGTGCVQSRWECRSAACPTVDRSWMAATFTHHTASFPRVFSDNGGSAAAAVQQHSHAQAQANPSAAIKSLEAAYARLPQGDAFDSVRMEIQQKIVSAKRFITTSKPLGVQLDSCRSAVQRAENRMTKAEESIAAAQIQLQEADVDRTRLLIELSQLGAQVATTPFQYPSNSVESMFSALANVLADMKSSPIAPPSLIEDAENHMACLMSGIQAISQMAQASVTSESGAGGTIDDELATGPDAASTVSGRSLRRAASEPYDPLLRRTSLRVKTPVAAAGFYSTLPGAAPEPG